MAKEMNEGTFKSEVLEGKGPAVIDFWAPWCGPCRIMGPIIESLAKKYEGKVNIAKVNVDDNQKLAGDYSVMSIPSILFFKNGKVIHTHMGATTEVDLDKQISKHLL